MNAQQVFDRIEQIAATPGKNDKLALLKDGMKSPLFSRVVCAAYNPRITYGMRDIPGALGAGRNTLDNEHAWAILDQLSSRNLSGDNARTVVRNAMGVMTPDSADLFKRIILKDMRAGFSEGSINKVAPKSLPEYPYMRCSLPAKSNIDKWTWVDGEVSQEKADGMFVNTDVDAAGEAALRTRQGQALPRAQFEQLHLDVERILCPDTQSHGEMLVYRDDALLPREDNNGYLNELIQGGTLQPNERVELHLWDQIDLECVVRGSCPIPYKERLTLLINQLRHHEAYSIKLVETRIVKSKGAAYDHFREMLALGKEGTVVKKGDALWKDGTSKDQVKLKLTAEVDLKIVGIVHGRAYTKNAGRPGSMTCVTSCGTLQTDVTVKNEKMRDEIEANPADWVGRIIKVMFNIVMVNEMPKLHSLFLPRMSETGYRIDKTQADSFAQVQAQYQAAIDAV